MEVIPWNSETCDYNYSGLSGDPTATDISNPILLIHGNGRDATDWLKHFYQFPSYGIDLNRLYAISLTQIFRHITILSFN